MIISIDIPDAAAPDLVDMYCAEGDYENNKLQDETRAQFAKRMHRQEVAKKLNDYRLEQFNNDYSIQNKAWQDDWEAANMPPEDVVVTDA